MKIASECYLCLFRQIYNLTRRMSLNESKAGELLRGSAEILSKYSMDVTPPEIAAEVYEFVAKTTGVKDPFLKAKKEAVSEALKFKKLFEEKLKSSENFLLDACKIAVAGNVIDLGVNQEYNIEKEIGRIFEFNFKYNDFEEFQKQLDSAQKIVYLADNAGENIFDEILVSAIKKRDVEVYYFVRGKPVINDVTFEDVKNLKIAELAEIVDTGVPSPGFHLNFANEKSKKLFYEADMVISKGMGNFECLFEECEREVFYFFKVKCDVVAKKIKAGVGDYILKKQ